MGDRRKCQTYAASPAEPGGLPVMLAGAPGFRTMPTEQFLYRSVGKFRVVRAAAHSSSTHSEPFGSRESPNFRETFLTDRIDPYRSIK